MFFDMICFLFFFFYKPGALSPAPNIINIVEREREREKEKEGGFDKSALTVVPANIIDSYFEREVERKGIVSVCVCAAVVSIFNGLFGGIIAYIIGALTTHNTSFSGGSITSHIGAELAIFNGLINGLSCSRGDATTIRIVGGFLYCFNFDTGAAIALATAAVVGYNNILFGYNTEPPDGVCLATNNNDIEYGLTANPIAIRVEFLGVFNAPYWELGDFNHDFNVLTCEFEMKKSGLSYEYDIDTIVKLIIFVVFCFFALSCL